MASDGYEKPSWLKAMENGSIGEARARAFLIDRFWILERSVDIDGADFLIQRRLTEKNFLDQKAPRLGVVQAKFAQDEGTTHYIHKNYVWNQNTSRPYGEFFVLLFSGYGETESIYLLSAEEISTQFRLSRDGRKYIVPARQVMRSKHFSVRNKQLSLDRIDHALKIAELEANRWFLRSTQYEYIEINADHIDYEYQLPFDNWWGDVKKQFFGLKERVRSLKMEMEDTIEVLRRILLEKDPVEALNIIEAELEISREEICFRAKDFWDPDFWEVATAQKKKASQLRERGLLEAYVALQTAIEDWIVDDLSPRMPLRATDSYEITVVYNSDTLALIDLSSNVSVSEVSRANEMRGHDVLVDKPGNVRIGFLPARWGFLAPGEGVILIEHESVADWRPLLRDRVWLVRRPIMECIESHLQLVE
ncbi:MAG: hypothetical protein ACLQPD_35390 [Desulfomonilaceae bacterium]